MPTRKDWGDLKDSHLRQAFKVYGSKTIEEAAPVFIEDPIRRAAELLVAPAAIFNYYTHCFINWLMSDKAKEEADGASAFLNLILSRLKKPDSADVLSVVSKIKPSIDGIADRQAFYDADINIYGSFLEKKDEIQHILTALGRFALPRDSMQ